LFSPALEQLLGPRRKPEDPLDDRHRDIACSAQAMYEEAFFHLLKTLQARTGLTDLTLAGGCAMNSVPKQGSRQHSVSAALRAVAVTHVGGSGRLQTVSQRTNPLYYSLIESFRNLAGVPMVLNTSFNENEPVVCEPRQARDCEWSGRVSGEGSLRRAVLKPKHS
jgi:predicted NodU family carbamoyl transferase